MFIGASLLQCLVSGSVLHTGYTGPTSQACMPCLADWPAQVVELYTEDGLDRPFFCIIATPESGNVVKIINTGPVEFPLTASVVRPHSRGDCRIPKLRLNAKC